MKAVIMENIENKTEVIVVGGGLPEFHVQSHLQEQEKKLYLSKGENLQGVKMYLAVPFTRNQHEKFFLILSKVHHLKEKILSINLHYLQKMMQL